MRCSIGEAGGERDDWEGREGKLAVRTSCFLLDDGSTADTAPASTPGRRCRLGRRRDDGLCGVRRARAGEPGAGVQGMSRRRRLWDGWPSRVRWGM